MRCGVAASGFEVDGFGVDVVPLRDLAATVVQCVNKFFALYNLACHSERCNREESCDVCLTASNVGLVFAGCNRNNYKILKYSINYADYALKNDQITEKHLNFGVSIELDWSSFGLSPSDFVASKICYG